MPLPFLFIIPAVLGAGISIKKSLTKNNNIDEAKKAIDSANNILENTKKNYEQHRDACSTALDNLGRKKISILDGSIKKFIKEAEQIKHIEVEKSSGVDELENFRINSKAFSELKEMSEYASSISPTMPIPAEIAISVIGGSFGGILLDTVHLAKSSILKDESLAKLAQAKRKAEEVQTSEVICDGIRRRCNMFYNLMVRLDAIFLPLVMQTESIINEHRGGYIKFSLEQQHTIAATFTLAKTIKTVLDTPILNENGELTDESERLIPRVQEQIREKFIRTLPSPKEIKQKTYMTCKNCGNSIKDSIDISNPERIFEAIENGEANTVRDLLNAGFDVNTKNDDGDTPLMTACYKGNSEIVKILIDAGADVNACGESGIRALDYANKIEIKKTLLDAGAIWNNFEWRTTFILPIKDVSYVCEGLTCVKGMVTHGCLFTNDAVQIVGLGKTIDTGIIAMDPPEGAAEGDMVSMLLYGIERNDVINGHFLVKPGTVDLATYECNLEEEGIVIKATLTFRIDQTFVMHTYSVERIECIRYIYEYDSFFGTYNGDPTQDGMITIKIEKMMTPNDEAIEQKCQLALRRGENTIFITNSDVKEIDSDELNEETVEISNGELILSEQNFARQS